jgi:adenylate cyclase
MLQAVEDMRSYFEAIHGRSFDLGIGLHYGTVIVGSVGWGAYKRRTIVGDAVNFASRVEAANKNVGTSFLISEDAYEQAGHEVEFNQCPPHGRFAARRVSTSSMKSSGPDRIPGDARAMS